MAMPAQQFDDSFVPDASNQRQMRDALGLFGTGVTIVTALSNEGPAAITANSFSSVSLAPPMVLWSLDRKSSRYHTFANATHYAIHVLNAKQESLCMEVARNPMRLRELNPTRNDYGVPVLDDCLVRFDCQREALYQGGDHVIILGNVQLVTTPDNCPPLAFFGGRTGTFTSQCNR